MGKLPGTFFVLRGRTTSRLPASEEEEEVRYCGLGVSFDREEGIGFVLSWQCSSYLQGVLGFVGGNASIWAVVQSIKKTLRTHRLSEC